MKLLMTMLIVGMTTFYCHADTAEIKNFIGVFQGEAEISQTEKRTLQVTIEEIKNGFNVGWKTITQASSGDGKSKSYSIDFVNSDRQGIYGSAMKTNLFGGQEALDPIKGEPYFWAKLSNTKLTIYGMLITEDGDYEVQRYDRTLQGDDMLLNYTLTRGNEVTKTITATLSRQ